MDRFPQELLRLIVEDVDYNSLEPLRLVNKAFAAAAAPFLFEVIPLWIGVRSLERLTSISEHPQLSQYSRRIFFSPIRFIDYGDDNAYKDEVKDWLESQTASPSIHALTIAKHMSAYRSYIEAQRLLSLNGLDVEILSRAFSQLPRLEALALDDYDYTIGSAELVHAFGAFQAGSLLNGECRHTLSVLVQALAASQTKIKVFKLGDDGDHYSSISGRDGDFTKAESLTMPRQSTSTTHRSYPVGDSAKALSRTFRIKNSAVCEQAFRGLREFRFGAFEGNLDCLSIFSRTIGALQNIMRCAYNLEIVTLGEAESETFRRPTLDSVMPSASLSNVKELRLRQFDTTIVALCDFFRRNSCNIVKVDFVSVGITGSNWSTALVQLRTIEFSRLEVFTLNYCKWDEESLQVQDYILKKTDEDPLMEVKERLADARVSRNCAMS